MNDDDFRSGTNPGDVSIETINNEQMMARNHITKLHTQKYKESVPPDLLIKVWNVSQVYDSTKKFHLDHLDKSKD